MYVTKVVLFVRCRVSRWGEKRATEVVLERLERYFLFEHLLLFFSFTEWVEKRRNSHNEEE